MLDKAEYSAFESTLNSSTVSYRIVKEPVSETFLAKGCAVVREEVSCLFCMVSCSLSTVM